MSIRYVLNPTQKDNSGSSSARRQAPGAGVPPQNSLRPFQYEAVPPPGPVSAGVNTNLAGSRPTPQLPSLHQVIPAPRPPPPFPQSAQHGTAQHSPVFPQGTSQGSASGSASSSRRKRAHPSTYGVDPDAASRRYVCDRPGCGYRFKQRGGLFFSIR